MIKGKLYMLKEMQLTGYMGAYRTIFLTMTKTKLSKCITT